MINEYDIRTVIMLAIGFAIAVVAYYGVVPEVCEVRYKTMECGE